MNDHGPRLAIGLAVTLLSLSPQEAEAQSGPTPSFKRRGVTSKAFPDGARGSRIALGDVDGDGDPDLLLSGKLLLNDGKGNFTWAPKSSKLRHPARAAIFLDYDRDGDLDVFQTGSKGNPDRLFRNDTVQGKRVTFTNVSQKVGAALNDRQPGEGIGAGDLNGDGRPDIYVANYENPGSTYDRLYLSQGKTRYRDASHLIAQKRIGRGVSMIDYDQDGDMDIFVSNYRLQSNLFWVNQRSQTGAFALSQRASSLGVAGTKRRSSYGHTIGSAWGDLDNDGDFDLVSANLAHPGRYKSFSNMTQVMLQRPDHTFATIEVERNPILGITYEESHSNPTLFDADNDGDLDLHFTSAYDDSYLYRNKQVEKGRLFFNDITTKSKTRTFRSWGAATADVDGDGDLDLIVTNGDRKPILLLNQHPPRFKSIRIRLVGRRSETFGIGAIARLSGGGAKTQTRQLTIGHGTTSQSEPILHFGLGRSKGPYKVRIRWPSGRVSHRRFTKAGLKTITEPKKR